MKIEKSRLDALFDQLRDERTGEWPTMKQLHEWQRKAREERRRALRDRANGIAGEIARMNVIAAMLRRNGDDLVFDFMGLDVEGLTPAFVAGQVADRVAALQGQLAEVQSDPDYQ